MDIFPEALEHFRKLLRFETVNPPGQERDAVHYIAEILKKEHLQPQIIESAEKRANLVVRIKGDGSAKPLLISSHVDVVGVEADKWKYPPFSAEISEGCVWGRGAVDMKNMTAYCLATMVTFAREKVSLKRDLIMSVVADEETGGAYGMKYLVAHHPELVTAEYALGELGGYTVYVQGKKIYPVQVGEKGVFWIKVKFHGSPGHGSIPKQDNAHFAAAQFLSRLHEAVMPYHGAASSKLFFDGLSKEFGALGGLSFKLLDSPFGPRILKKLEKNSADPERFASLRAMLSNTVNPTGLESGRQHNVVPSTVTLKLDCRTMPGLDPKQLISEIEKVTQMKFEYEIIQQSLGYESPHDTPLFAIIKRQIESADPDSKVIPNLTVGFTDAQHLKKLGVVCYGFTPIKLPPEINFPKLYHGHNERIPVDGFRWGLDVFMKTVREFCS